MDYEFDEITAEPSMAFEDNSENEEITNECIEICNDFDDIFEEDFDDIDDEIINSDEDIKDISSDEEELDTSFISKQTLTYFITPRENIDLYYLNSDIINLCIKKLKFINYIKTNYNIKKKPSFKDGYYIKKSQDYNFIKSLKYKIMNEKLLIDMYNNVSHFDYKYFFIIDYYELCFRRIKKKLIQNTTVKSYKVYKRSPLSSNCITL